MNKTLINLLSIVICSAILLSCGICKESIPIITEPISDAPDKKQSLFNKLEENNHLDIEERIKLYYKLKKENWNEYDFGNERALNQYGYLLLSEGKVKEAIEIFNVLVAEFPNSSNAYDSLGEGYLKSGNEELSLLNYEKSIELNPKNTGAIDQINRIRGLELLVTDWGKEIFHFPLHFAPEIPYEGIEEAVFPKNWIKPDSNDFWSYVFVWGLENKQTITSSELETSLKQYFDGLMEGVKDDKVTEIMKTRTKFKRNLDSLDYADFIGELTIFDAFATNDSLTLNARIVSNYCEERNKLILLFQFSPKEFNEPIWDKLRTVIVRPTVCKIP